MRFSVPFSDLFGGSWGGSQVFHFCSDGSPLASAMFLYENDDNVILLSVDRCTS